MQTAIPYIQGRWSLDFREIIDMVARALEGFGVLVLVAGVLWSGISAVTRRADSDMYSHVRRTLGRTILLGLEILVAADIVHTIAVTPSFESLAVLGLLILIRTFLSIEIEMELEGRWPWKRASPAPTESSEG